MSSRLTYLRDGRPKRGGQAGRRAVPNGVPRVALDSADYKRVSARAPLVFVPMTGAHPCGGRWSRRGALLQVTGVGGPSARRVRASIDHNSRGKKE